MDHNQCTTQRRMLISHSLLSLTTGESRPDPDKPAEWVTRACAVPLFGDDERKRGTCRACAGGYKHPNNYPAAELPPLFEVRASTTDHSKRDPDTGRPIVRPRHAIDAGAAYWLEGAVLIAAPLAPHKAIPTWLLPEWDEAYEVDPAFPGYAALASALA